MRAEVAMGGMAASILEWGPERSGSLDGAPSRARPHPPPRVDQRCSEPPSRFLPQGKSLGAFGPSPPRGALGPHSSAPPAGLPAPLSLPRTGERAQHWAQCSGLGSPVQSRAGSSSLPCWLCFVQCLTGNHWPARHTAGSQTPCAQFLVNLLATIGSQGHTAGSLSPFLSTTDQPGPYWPSCSPSHTAGSLSPSWPTTGHLDPTDPLGHQVTLLAHCHSFGSTRTLLALLATKAHCHPPCHQVALLAHGELAVSHDAMML